MEINENFTYFQYLFQFTEVLIRNMNIKVVSLFIFRKKSLRETMFLWSHTSCTYMGRIFVDYTGVVQGTGA